MSRARTFARSVGCSEPLPYHGFPTRARTLHGLETRDTRYRMPEPKLKSFVPVPPDSHFPIQNLPYGVFRRRGTPRRTIGVAIGDHVLDLKVLQDDGLLRTTVFSLPSLNPFM